MFRRTPSGIKIVAGTNKWNLGGSTYEAEKFIVHKQHDSPQFAYDIGLIRVQTPISFDEKVQPIKFSKKFIPAGFNLMVTGWGRLSVSEIRLFIIFIFQLNKTLP